MGMVEGSGSWVAAERAAEERVDPLDSPWEELQDHQPRKSSLLSWTNPPRLTGRRLGAAADRVHSELSCWLLVSGEGSRHHTRLVLA
jgi:hypothetical protein